MHSHTEWMGFSRHKEAHTKLKCEPQRGEEVKVGFFTSRSTAMQRGEEEGWLSLDRAIHF